MVAHANQEAVSKNLLKAITDLPVDNGPAAEVKFDLELQLQNQAGSQQRLADRIKRAVKQLTEKDKLSARALENARKDPFLSLHLRARAMKQRLRNRIRERRFESERLERSYFRATLG